ncbi:MAG: ABC transporter ATP-binding protein, partial [Sulfurimonas sp.]
MIDIDINKPLLGSCGTMQLCVKLCIESGSFVALTGASGSGKTTFLRILAGLESAQGHIRIGSEVWLEGSRALAPQQRRIGFVFQEYALFTHMSVEENLLFVAKDKALAE